MSKFKRAFTSRFSGGSIVEVDWSQLEINVLAVESQDKELTEELTAGVDLHTKMTAEIHKVPYTYVDTLVKDHDAYWTERRRETKRARFALQYGAYAPRLAQLTGWDLDFAENFIKKYYEKYEGIARWQKMVAAEVERTAKPAGVDGTMKGQYTSPSGKRYVFQTYPTKSGKHKFSPNQMKNYPIQGLASDFVGHMVGKLNRALLCNLWSDKALIVNTVHDSVILDVHPSMYYPVSNVIEEVYGLAQVGLFEVVQGMRPVTVPLRYSVSGGHSWSK